MQDKHITRHTNNTRQRQKGKKERRLFFLDWLERNAGDVTRHSKADTRRLRAENKSSLSGSASKRQKNESQGF